MHIFSYQIFFKPLIEKVYIANSIVYFFIEHSKVYPDSDRNVGSI